MKLSITAFALFALQGAALAQSNSKCADMAKFKSPGVEASYIGTRGINLLSKVNTNQPFPGPGPRLPRSPLYPPKSSRRRFELPQRYCPEHRTDDLRHDARKHHGND